jgi:hypothetical protein
MYMDDFFKQDVFFFVTTIAVVVLTILVSILCIRLIRISKKIDYITDKAREQTDLISDDLSKLREDIHSKGLKIKHFLEFWKRLKKRSK